ncbi:MAG: hypothetical protein HQ510_10435 [Candidatus Marinimicrobia bacterium]|nr:hypothetical protein [Candidatus Neomarinimicrobiota bacterium]
MHKFIDRVIIVRFHLVIFLMISSPILLSQHISDEQAHSFIHYLIQDSDSISEYFSTSEIELSNRLGIHYTEQDRKYLISYDIDEDIKSKISREEIFYDLTIVPFNDGYSKVFFSVSDPKYEKEFFFKGDKYISPVSYYTRQWQQIVSPHFKILISDGDRFNGYCIDHLEKFFLKMTEILEFDTDQLDRIESAKILYYLCKDTDEIEKLTGYPSRGMVILASDAVITTYPVHHHELCHLLINYKLQNLPVYTHPFFQEGFAVAFGGRGGKEPNVILNLGMYLSNSGLLDYTGLSSKANFYQNDPSLSYPVSGLYSSFLVDQLGIEDYLKLYQKYSGSAKDVDGFLIAPEDLPESLKWQHFLQKSELSSITFDVPDREITSITDDDFAKIGEDSTRYYFEVKDTLLIKCGKADKNYRSLKFNENFPSRLYAGETYLILVNETELSVYNLFTNNLIDSFDN